MRARKRRVSRDRLRRVAEQARHLLRRLQMALGIDLEPAAGLADGDAFADAGEHVLQVALAGRGVEHVVDGEERQAMRLPRGRAGAASRRRSPPRRVIEAPSQAAPGAASARRGRRRASASGRGAGITTSEKAGGIGQKVVEVQDAVALLGARSCRASAGGRAGPSRAGPRDRRGCRACRRRRRAGRRRRA